jgi:hypothetical protein
MKRKQLQKLTVKRTTVINLTITQSTNVKGGIIYTRFCSLRFTCMQSVCNICFSELDCTTPGICEEPL